MATRHHYLSRCIIENFITQDNKTFLEYNCELKTSRARNIDKLFAKFRSWDPWFEVELSRNFEDELAPVLKKYCEVEVFQPHFKLLGNELVVYPMSGFQIEPSYDRGIISRLINQQILIQLSKRSHRSGVPDEATISLFSKNSSLLMHPAIFETNPLLVKEPLIIVDGMPFLFMAPAKDPTKLCKLCFMFPISETRFFIWGSSEDCEFFVKKYRNITYLNLCRIEQQDKKCGIASQNFEYLSKLIPLIDSFNSGEQIKIELIRDVEQLNQNSDSEENSKLTT